MSAKPWRVRVLASGLLTIAASSSAQDQPARYDIRLGLDPAAGALEATVTMSGLACSGDRARLYLNRGLSVTQVSVDGRVALARLDPPDAEPFWLSASRAIGIPCPLNTAEMTYSGPGRLHPDGRNQVSSDLVELSLYGGWYPMTAIDRPFVWRLRTALPNGWIFAAAGSGHQDRPASIDLASRQPSDVVLIASPRFTDETLEIEGRTARVLISDDAPTEARAAATVLAREAADMSAWLERVLGSAQDGQAVRPELVFTRRGGPLSYSRLPLIVTPQASLLAPGDRPLALNIRHEVAHFWFRSRGSANDWISEGMAEYLALLRTRDREGEEAYHAGLALYRDEVRQAGSGVSIAETSTDESRGYVNRYQRPVLLMDAVESSVGRRAVEIFLKRLFALGADQTTDTFRRLATDSLGAREGARVSACLLERDWPASCGGAPAG